MLAGRAEKIDAPVRTATAHFDAHSDACHANQANRASEGLIWDTAYCVTGVLFLRHFILTTLCSAVLSKYYSTSYHWTRAAKLFIRFENSTSTTHLFAIGSTIII